MNDKRLYAKRRCEMLLADGENWGHNPYGTKEGIEAVSPEELLLKAWEHMLRNSQVEILAMGDCDASAVEKLFEEAFSQHGKKRCFFISKVCRSERERVVRHDRKMPDVAQSNWLWDFRPV